MADLHWITQYYGMGEFHRITVLGIGRISLDKQYWEITEFHWITQYWEMAEFHLITQYWGMAEFHWITQY
jgi:hypothetical protein